MVHLLLKTILNICQQLTVRREREEEGIISAGVSPTTRTDITRSKSSHELVARALRT